LILSPGTAGQDASGREKKPDVWQVPARSEKVTGIPPVLPNRRQSVELEKHLQRTPGGG